ncbi:MAG: TonB-dependent receptor [Wenzhouxiangellaceae bacterium]
MLQARYLLFLALAIAFQAGNKSHAQTASPVVKQYDSRSLSARVDPLITPLIVLHDEDIKRSGFNDLGEILRQLPIVNGSPLSLGNATGDDASNTAALRAVIVQTLGQSGQPQGSAADGSSRADLRALGIDRTLVLVNGRRDIAAGDFSTLPLAMVERIEILPYGGSTLYGPDAIGGIINLITHTDFSGVEVTAQYGESFDLAANPAAQNDRSVHGSDGGQTRLSLIAGLSRQRGYVRGGIEYQDHQPVFNGNIEQPQYRLPLVINDLDRFLSLGLDDALTATPGAGDNPPVAIGGSTRTADGLFLTGQGLFTRDRNTGELRPANLSSIEQFGGDLYNSVPPQLLRAPLERTQLFAEAGINLNDHLMVYSEARYSERESRLQFAPLFIDSSFNVAANQAFNPFADDLINVNRRLVEAGGDQRQLEVEQLQLVLGLAGDFGGNQSPWRWDVSAQWGRREFTFNQRTLNPDTTTLALGPSFIDDQGQAVCGAVDDPLAGCVPLNLFGGAGSITPAMLDYILTDDRHYRSVERQSIIEARLGGPLLSLPAGELMLEFGYQFRHQSLSERAPPLFNAVDSLRLIDNDFDAHSVWLNSHLPLLADAAGNHRLAAQLALRYNNSDAYDADLQVQAGLHWQASDALSWHGQYALERREPRLRELWTASFDRFPAFNDPCARELLGGGAGNAYSQLTPEQQARCQLTGAPVGGHVQNDLQLRTLNGGNTELELEQAQRWQTGLIITPPSLPDWRLQLDYWRIAIDDVIASFTAPDVLNGCVLQGQIDLCPLINRFDDGNINRIDTRLRNLGEHDASGLDVQLQHQLATSAGQFNSRLLLSYLIENEQRIATEQELAGRYVNHANAINGAVPDWKGQFTVDWRYQQVSAGLSVEYLAAIDEMIDNGNQSATRQIDAQWYVDLSASYDFAMGLELSLGVTNLFANDAPLVIDQLGFAATDVDSYRPLGRSWFARAQYRF